MSFWNSAGLISLVLLLTLVIVIAGLVVLVFLLRKPMREYKWADLAVFNWLDARTSPGLNKFILFITFLANHKFLIPANLLLIGYFLFIRDQSWFSVQVAAIAISSLVLMLILKSLFRRKRPLAPLLKAVRGLSFPSGHSIMAVTFYGLIIHIVNRLEKDGTLKFILILALVILILLIGFSRIYMRVHYLSDVLAGFVIGFLWLLISLAVLNKVEDYFKEKERQKPSLTSGSHLPFSLIPPCYHQM